jgi:hypothetical protein
MNPIKRRMAQSVESRSPGFYGIVVGFHPSTRTCDVKIQGGRYTLKNVRYNTTLNNPPSFVYENCAVFVRQTRGSKFSFEIEGPALVVPTPIDGSNQFVVPPTTPNTALSGLRVVASCVPGQRVAVTTGTARLNGVVTTFSVCKLGESLNSKVSGAVPGILELGEGAQLGNTYCYIPLANPPAAGSGLFRIDNIELGQDGIIYYVQGTASSNPSIPTVGANRILLAYIMRHPGVDITTDDHINTSSTFNIGSKFLLISIARPRMEWNDAATNAITVSAFDYLKSPLPSIGIQCWIASGSGTITPPTANTNTFGDALFLYQRLNTADDKSVTLKAVMINDPAVEAINWITLLNSSGGEMY